MVNSGVVVLNRDGLSGGAVVASVVRSRERAHRRLLSQSPAVVSLLTSIVTSPQLSVAVASSKINSSEHSAV